MAGWMKGSWTTSTSRHPARHPVSDQAYQASWNIAVTHRHRRGGLHRHLDTDFRSTYQDDVPCCHPRRRGPGPAVGQDRQPPARPDPGHAPRRGRGRPHAIAWTHADQVNTALLDFLHLNTKGPPCLPFSADNLKFPGDDTRLDSPRVRIQVNDDRADSADHRLEPTVRPHRVAPDVTPAGIHPERDLPSSSTPTATRARRRRITFTFPSPRTARKRDRYYATAPSRTRQPRGAHAVHPAARRDGATRWGPDRRVRVDDSTVLPVVGYLNAYTSVRSSRVSSPGNLRLSALKC